MFCTFLNVEIMHPIMLSFRLRPPGDHTSLHLQPALTLQLDKLLA